MMSRFPAGSRTSAPQVSCAFLIAAGRASRSSPLSRSARAKDHVEEKEKKKREMKNGLLIAQKKKKKKKAVLLGGKK